MDDEFKLVKFLKTRPSIKRVELTFLWGFTSFVEVGPYVIEYTGRRYDWDYCFRGSVEGLSGFLKDYPWWDDEYDLLTGPGLNAHISHDGTTFRMCQEGYTDGRDCVKLPDAECIYDMESTIIRRVDEPITKYEKNYVEWC